MADVVEVVARLGDTIVAVAHGARVTVGDSDADVYAPASRRTFALDTSDEDAHAADDDAILVGEPISTTAGLLTLDIRRVAAAAERVPRKRLEGRAAAYIGISLLVHLALWSTSMRVYPGETVALHVGIARAMPVHVSRGHDAMPTPQDLDDGPPVPITMALDWTGNGIGPIADIVGHASVDVVEDPSTTRTVDDLENRRARAIGEARTAGVLGAESLRGERALGDIPGTGEPASGFDGRAIDGSARGESAHQAFASDRRLVGGCTHEPCGTIGTGRYATLCGSGPKGDGPCRYGTNGYGVAERPRERKLPTVHICGNPDPFAPKSSCVKIVGDLTKEIIRRYIRRKLPAILACYEKALLVAETMQGKIDTEFLIDPTGHVRDVKATGMDPEVASCIGTVLGTIQFPLSDGGGSTQVHYPFSFIVAGS